MEIFIFSFTMMRIFCHFLFSFFHFFNKMYPKGYKQGHNRSSKPRKRIYHGNQHTNKGEKSSSAKKLKTSASKDILPNSNICYRIIEFFTIFSVLQNVLQCKKCQNDIIFRNRRFVVSSSN